MLHLWRHLFALAASEVDLDFLGFAAQLLKLLLHSPVHALVAVTPAHLLLGRFILQLRAVTFMSLGRRCLGLGPHTEVA